MCLYVYLCPVLFCFLFLLFYFGLGFVMFCSLPVLFFSKEGEKEDIELDGWGGGEDLRGNGGNCAQNVMYEKKSFLILKNC